MTSKNDGGPAFPRNSIKLPDGNIEVGHNGMSLRDWFAGQALKYCSEQNPGSKSGAAEEAYKQADAMLKARK